MAITQPIPPVQAVTVNGTALSLTVNAGALTGDLLLVWESLHSVTDTTSTPVGWNKLTGVALGSINATTVLFWRVATAGDPSTAYSFTPGANGAVGVLQILRNENSSGNPPFDPATASTNSGLTAATCPSVTPTGATDWYLCGVGLAATGVTMTTAGSLVEETGSPWSNAGGNTTKVELGLVHVVLSASGATGTFSPTLGASANNIECAVCVAAAGPAVVLTPMVFIASQALNRACRF